MSFFLLLLPFPCRIAAAYLLPSAPSASLLLPPSHSLLSLSDPIPPFLGIFRGAGGEEEGGREGRSEGGIGGEEHGQFLWRVAKEEGGESEEEGEEGREGRRQVRWGGGGGGRWQSFSSISL
jgi:hypothetical protein